MGLQDRLSEYLVLKSLTYRDFERNCNLSNGTAARLRESTRKSTFDRIANSCDLNINWLLTGEGEMLKGETDTFQVPTDIYREDEIPARYMTRLVPMAAMGGSLVGFEEEGIRRENCERVISPIADADWAVPVCGDSMEPEYPNGSRVFVKRINPGDFISWGNVFVLDTTNGLVIKVVVKSDMKDCVRCVSLNRSERYQPFDVPLHTIRAMYRVLLCVSMK